MKPKHIPKVCIKDSHVMSAMELNRERFRPKHTVLTPELVEELARKGGGNQLTDDAPRS